MPEIMTEKEAQALKARRARRRRKREAMRRKRQRQIRIRLAILAIVIIVALIGVGVVAFGNHKKNVREQEAALAASREIAEQQEAAAAEASRIAAEEAAAEASRKAAEEAKTADKKTEEEKTADKKTEEAKAADKKTEAAAAGSTSQAPTTDDQKAAEQKKTDDQNTADQKKTETATEKSSREKAEEEGALAASRKAAEEEKAREEAGKIPGLNKSYDFKTTDQTEDVPDDIDSEYAVIVDLVSGNVIAGRNYDETMYPASMTKILTLLVAAENIDRKKLDTDTYEIHQGITSYVYSNQMSQVGWGIGDTPSIRSLMYGTILPSGADGALALAEYTAGSEEAFVELMNKKLKELGISDTAHFTNVVGAFDEDHYCTALDMATILRAAIDNELCREVLSCHYYEVERSLDDDAELIGISNWFLRRIEDKDTHGEVICGKTGFVSEAGYCAASYQKSDGGGHYICVTADGPGIWPCIYDHVELYETYTE